MARKGANNRLLVILLGLIVLVCLGMWYADKVEKEGLAAQQAAGAVEDSDDAATTRVEVGDEAPDFTVAMVGGDSLRLSSLRGKVVLLNFWATWCPPCREELSHVQEQILDRFAGQEFVFLPVSRGEKPAEVEAFRKQTGYTFPMGLDPEKKVYDLYATNYIPRNFLIDREGRIVKISIGYDEEEFAALILSIERTLRQGGSADNAAGTNQ